MKRKPNILVTNDDGIYSDGIYALVSALKRVGNVSVIAPQTEQSAVGHAITMSAPLRVKEYFKGKKFFGYAISGTPADCVKIGIRSLLKNRPDLVVSGINAGPNTGFSVLYSGTVSGATEGAILGIPSIAVSLGAFGKSDYVPAANFAAKTSRMVLKNGLPKGVFLSINVPAIKKDKIKGVKVTRQGRTPIIESFIKRIDPHDKSYYWLTGEVLDLAGDEESDIKAVKEGWISITPLHYELTAREYLHQLRTWNLRF